jgi:7-carboxy-7-deazaguanine synthase
MFGDNPKRLPVSGDGNILYVKDIFATIQGEGPFVGRPSIFLRLGGCNLACKFCDTEFEDFQEMNLEAIISKILQIKGKSDLVVITGGEPLRQPISKICTELLNLGLKVQIETNGTLFRDLPKDVKIVCSPKSSSNGYSRIREDLLPKISAIKFLISKNNAKYSDISDVGQNDYNIPVYVQPMDEYDEILNKQNLELALSIAINTGYTISSQMHKIYGIP